MRKDDELIAKILKWIAMKDHCRCVRARDMKIEGYSFSQIGYHLILMDEYGLVNCERVKSKTSDRVIEVMPFFLSAKGQDWLAHFETPAKTPPKIGFLDLNGSPPHSALHGLSS